MSDKVLTLKVLEIVKWEEFEAAILRKAEVLKRECEMWHKLDIQ